MPLMSGGQLVLADRVPQVGYTSVSYPSTGLNLSNLFASYGTIYTREHWVKTVVRKRAMGTARLPLKVYRRSDGGRTEARESSFARLLRMPNSKHNPFFFWEWTSSTFDVFGEAIWLKLRDAAGIPVELWPIHPSNIAVRQREGRPTELEYVYGVGVVSGGDAEYVIPERDVVHFKTYNPESTLRGMSPLEPLRQTLVNENAARRASAAFWQNGARPSMYLSHPAKISDEAAQRLKAQWDSIHGGVDNFGKTAVLEEGMEPHSLSLSAEEAQYIESRRLNREEICAAYDVPPPVVQILDRATFSNITEQMRSMYRDTMAPHLGAFEAEIDRALRPDFGEDALYAEFLMDEVLRGSFEARQQAYQQADYMTIAEKRQAENLPYISGTENIFLNSASLPLDTLLNPPSSGEDVVVRSVMGRLSRVASLDEIDEKALTAGLNGSTATVLDALAEARAAGDDVAGFRARLRTILTGGSHAA